MTNDAKSGRKVWLGLVFATVIMSSLGTLSSEAFAQVLPTVTTAISLNNVQSTSGTTNSSNQITLSNFAPGAGDNEVLVVGVSANNAATASVTYAGISLVRAISSNQNNDAEIWYLVHPPSSGNIVVTMTGPTQAVVGAYSFTNVDQNNPIPTTASQYNTKAGSPSVMVTTKYPGDWVIDVPSIYGGSTLTSPTCTQEWNINMPDAISGASSAREAQFPAQVTCSWTATPGDMWDDVAVELKDAGATLLGTTIGTGTINSTLGGLTGLTSVTVYAHRIPAAYWDPCFATTCSAGTGPGASMYFVLYDSNMNVLQTGFADENGYTFSGLSPLSTYYVYPDDCDNCHGSPHDVVFQYWGDNYSSERPRETGTGAQLHAWYSCTNNCAGGP